jgi:hypothetical protein
VSISSVKAVFLFGAGASKFSDTDDTPPLGADLYLALKKADFLPKNLPNHIKFIFENNPNFEEGMLLLSKESSWHYNSMQRNIALFLSSFTASPNNLYKQLIDSLYGHYSEFIFSTLNYDLLIESAAFKSRAIVCYSHVGWLNALRYPTLRLFKLHGSSNFLPHPDFKISGIKIVKPPFGNENMLGDTDFSIKVARNHEEIVRWYKTQDESMAPAMSMYMKGKPNPHGSSFIQHQCAMWEQSLAAASVCYIVGMKYNPDDNHIWDLLAKSKCQIRYVDPSPELFLAWSHSHGRKDVHLSPTFREALPIITKEIKYI